MIDYDFGRRIFVLEIGGLSIRYVSSDVDVSSSNLNANLTTGVPYVNKQGIVSVGAYQASIDPAGGIANYSPLTVSLSIDRFRGDTTDPHVIFGRCGPRSTDVSRKRRSQLIYSIRTRRRQSQSIKTLLLCPSLVSCISERRPFAYRERLRRLSQSPIEESEELQFKIIRLQLEERTFPKSSQRS